MKRLGETFDRLHVRKEGAFMPFLVIGDPNPEQSMQLSAALLRGGADILEFGLPFSDPPADGPVIQAADKRALAAGMNVERAFSYMETLRSQTDTPFTMLVYYNLVLHYGVERFYARAAAAGVDGILVADLPIEEADEALTAARQHDVAQIFIVSELTSAARMTQIVQVAQGYLYLVARLGVTGERLQVSPQLSTTIDRLHGLTRLPLLAGFGLSLPEQVSYVIGHGADGAICGSAIVRRIAEHLSDPPRLLAEIEDFTRKMKAATREQR